MHMTKQRRVILDVLKKTDTHPSADVIYDSVRRVIPDVSLGTVYRNLEKLSSTGMILKLDTGTGQKRYDGNTHLHYHMLCWVCSRVIDTPMHTNIKVEYEENNLDGFQVEDYVFILRGVCLSCRSEKKKEN